MALKPDGSQIWVADRNDDSVSIIDRVTETKISTVHLKKKVPSKGKGKGSQEIKIGQRPVEIAFFADGLYACVLGQNSNNLILIDTAKAITDPANAIVGYVDVGEQPVALAVDHEANLVYVVIRRDNHVAVVDVSIPSAPVVRKKIAVGKEPSGIAITKPGSFVDGDYVYVANSKDGTVSVIDAVDDTIVPVIDGVNNSVVPAIPVGKGPKGVAAGIVPTAP